MSIYRSQRFLTSSRLILLKSNSGICSTQVLKLSNISVITISLIVAGFKATATSAPLVPYRTAPTGIARLRSITILLVKLSMLRMRISPFVNDLSTDGSEEYLEKIAKK